MGGGGGTFLFEPSSNNKNFTYIPVIFNLIFKKCFHTYFIPIIKTFLQFAATLTSSLPTFEVLGPPPGTYPVPHFPPMPGVGGRNRVDHQRHPSPRLPPPPPLSLLLTLGSSRIYQTSRAHYLSRPPPPAANMALTWADVVREGSSSSIVPAEFMPRTRIRIRVRICMYRYMSVSGYVYVYVISLTDRVIAIGIYR
jgi:hypothetical protein